jgi:hypothetical protein
MYKEAFWVLILITVVTLFLHMNGYAMIETVIFLITMDFIAMWIYLENRKSSSGLNEFLVKRIENIESICSGISENIGTVPSVLKLEEKVDRQKEDINSMLERIKEKNMELELKLDNFGQSLTNSVGQEGEEDSGIIETY